jgi:hypothetical protein
MSETSMDETVECPTCGQAIRLIELQCIAAEQQQRARDAWQEAARLEYDVDALPWEPLPNGARQHSERFRRISDRYPRRVTEADGGDIERAARDSDEQVFAPVAAWERAQGFDPLDWDAIGAEERDESGESPAT